MSTFCQPALSLLVEDVLVAVLQVATGGKKTLISKLEC